MATTFRQFKSVQHRKVSLGFGMGFGLGLSGTSGLGDHVSATPVSPTMAIIPALEMVTVVALTGTS
ncbi:hypothetical protein [Lactiplantibacillus carotarum]|uniref:hypothetical protein n=1 Tax=Lactiplantibacillus carotarum TaxID=2993456 RepID=UPI00298F2FE7|nr:hypothetical protein [Lactiplantibacillus carotarum]